jgi:5-methylcytosine-specific restriction endonuclease McrA
LEKEIIKENFSKLDYKKTPEQKAFYSSHKWHTTSLAHRKIEPLCRRCKAKGLIVPAQMVHHAPPVEVLLQEGKSPFDHQYLESLCNNCHLAELRKKKLN